MKNKNVFIIEHLMEVSSIKVPLRSCYVVGVFVNVSISLFPNEKAYTDEQKIEETIHCVPEGEA